MSICSFSSVDAACDVSSIVRDARWRKASESDGVLHAPGSGGAGRRQALSR